MKAIAAAASDVGRVRDHNEDGYLIQPPLYAVADGMGGHLGGEVASAIALETLAGAWRSEGLAEAMRAANDAVYGRALSDITVAGMGTTLTALQIDGSRVLLAHVGDSRAYLMHDGSLRALTHDHSLVGDMVRAGEITEEEARVHPRRNIMTRAVGIDPDVDVDEDSIEVTVGDRLLLCSDGLCGLVQDDAIAAILAANAEPEAAAQALIDAANDAGGYDNVTVVVLDVVEGEPEATEDQPAQEAEPKSSDEDRSTAEYDLAVELEREAEPEGTNVPGAPDQGRGLLGRLFRRS